MKPVCRWEKDTRYYEVHIGRDLWGEWGLARIRGRSETALEQLAAVAKRRTRRGYVLINESPNRFR